MHVIGSTPPEAEGTLGSHKETCARASRACLRTGTRLPRQGGRVVRDTSPTLHQCELGERLRELRNAYRLTLEEVAAALLCSLTKMSRLETGTARSAFRMVSAICACSTVSTRRSKLCSWGLPVKLGSGAGGWIMRINGRPVLGSRRCRGERKFHDVFRSGTPADRGVRPDGN